MGLYGADGPSGAKLRYLIGGEVTRQNSDSDSENLK